jgi:hypothetical protein
MRHLQLDDPDQVVTAIRQSASLPESLNETTGKLLTECCV